MSFPTMLILPEGGTPAAAESPIWSPDTAFRAADESVLGGLLTALTSRDGERVTQRN